MRRRWRRSDIDRRESTTRPQQLTSPRPAAHSVCHSKSNPKVKHHRGNLSCLSLKISNYFFKQHLSPLPNHSENHAPWSSFRFYNFCKRLPCLLTGKEWACTKIIRLSPCRKWPNTQENGCWLPQSDHIHRRYPFPDQEWGIIGQASVLHSWQRVMFFLKSCWLTQKSSFSSCKI